MGADYIPRDSAREKNHQHWFAPLAQANNASLAFAICYLALWMLVAWGLYRKKTFIKV